MGEPNSTEAVRLDGITRTYGVGDNTVTALDNVSSIFPVGSFTAVMGPSGSGKSTLLQCAAGLDRPTAGRVVVAGQDLTDLDDTALTVLRRKHIGFIFQAFNLVSALTVEQNVGLPLRLAGVKPDRTDVSRALAAVGLEDRARHRPGQLSGGQLQRVAIARSMIMQPSVIFADEPTGALDSNSGRKVLEHLRRIVDEQQQTVVMVTHDPVAASFADTVILLVDGRLVDRLDGPTTADVATRLAHLEVGR